MRSSRTIEDSLPNLRASFQFFGVLIVLMSLAAQAQVKGAGPACGTAQLSNGKAKLTISSLHVGSTKVTTTYNGDSNIARSSASVTQTVH
jgi:hypothetical protein